MPDITNVYMKRDGGTADHRTVQHIILVAAMQTLTSGYTDLVLTSRSTGKMN